jgi:serine/threonine protein kinase/tetratricopeptide (TPR) repeat protein
MIGKTLGRYLVSEKIGAGGMGEVYRAKDPRLDRDVALKVLTARALTEETNRKRFRKEALVLSKLNHPNIATILDYDTQDDFDFLVMEYIIGTTLHELLAKGPLPEKQIIQIALQIADALEEAHTMGVIHRDLKPINILVTPKGQVKVLDFGLAKLMQPLNNEEVQHLSTETNLVIGTVPYMSPEQLRSEPLDARSDIYSLGVVLYEMTTGQRPHLETQPISLVDAILHKIPSPPANLRHDLSPRLQEIILKCLEKNPENRYQSVKELSVDLRRLATPSMFTSTILSGPKRLPRRMNMRFLILYGAIPLAILIAIFTGLRYLGKRKVDITHAPQIDSIVALPSKVYGSDENRFLSDAIPNALSTYLSQVDGLETKVPPTNVEVDRLGGDLTNVARVYGVPALIASSVTTQGNRFILNVQLIEAKTRRLVWSRDYDGKKDNYPDLVRNAAEGIRSVLRPNGSPFAEQAEVRSTDAELIYQRGYHHLRSYYNLKQAEDYEDALSDLKRALELDPNNARAAAYIARLYISKIESGASLGEILPEADKWAYQAIQIDHRCGEAWQVLSVAEELRPNGDPHKRLEYSLKAATYANDSGYSHHVLASALSGISFSMAERCAREGYGREPLYLNGLLFTAGILSREGKAKEGLQLINQVLSVEPNMPIAMVMKTYLLLRNHQFQEAEKLSGTLDKLVAERRLHPGWVDFAREWLDFEKSIGTTDTQRANAALSRLVSEARGQAPPFFRWQVITGNVLGIEAEHDTVDGTLETLRLRADLKILEPYDWLLLSPELNKIRKDSRFQNIVTLSRAEFEQTLTILDAAKSRNELPLYLQQPLAEAHKLLK